MLYPGIARTSDIIGEEIDEMLEHQMFVAFDIDDGIKNSVGY
jgi:hypothetical protein